MASAKGMEEAGREDKCSASRSVRSGMLDTGHALMQCLRHLRPALRISLVSARPLSATIALAEPRQDRYRGAHIKQQNLADGKQRSPLPRSYRPCRARDHVAPCVTQLPTIEHTHHREWPLPARDGTPYKPYNLIPSTPGRQRYPGRYCNGYSYTEHARHWRRLVGDSAGWQQPPRPGQREEGHVVKTGIVLASLTTPCMTASCFTPQGIMVLPQGV